MRAIRAFALVALVGLTMGGCQTITEELPTGRRQRRQPVQIPVLPSDRAVPAQIPTYPRRPPEPAPERHRRPRTRTPLPAPPGTADLRRQIPNNINPVTKVGAKVYFLECDGQMVPGTESRPRPRSAAAIHFDCTPKDANNNPTQSQRHAAAGASAPAA